MIRIVTAIAALSMVAVMPAPQASAQNNTLGGAIIGGTAGAIIGGVGLLVRRVMRAVR